jgi:hypothetical protein
VTYLFLYFIGGLWFAFGVFSIAIGLIVARLVIQLFHDIKNRAIANDLERNDCPQTHGILVTISQQQPLMNIKQFEQLCNRLLEMLQCENNDCNLIVVADSTQDEEYSTSLATVFMRILNPLAPQAIRSSLIIGDYPHGTGRRQIMQSFRSAISHDSTSPVLWIQPKSGLRQSIVAGVEYLLATAGTDNRAVDKISIFDGDHMNSTDEWCFACELAPVPDGPLCGQYDATEAGNIIDRFLRMRSFDSRNPFEAAGDWNALVALKQQQQQEHKCFGSCRQYTLADRLIMQSFNAFRRLQRLSAVSDNFRAFQLNWLIDACWPLACWSLLLSWTVVEMIQRPPAPPSVNEWPALPAHVIAAIAIGIVVGLNAIQSAIIDRRPVALLFQPARDAFSLLFRPPLHLLAMIYVMSDERIANHGRLLMIGSVICVCLWWSLLAVSCAKSFSVL